MKKFVVFFCILSFVSSFSFAQNTTSLTGTVVDSDGQAWVNATWSAVIVTPGGTNAKFITGENVPSYNGSLDNNGAFLVGAVVGNTSNIVPAGSTWLFTICSLTSAPCNKFSSVNIQGSTFNAGNYFSGLAIAPRISASNLVYAYRPTEIVNAVNGSGYVNTVQNSSWIWNGVTWVPSGSAANFSSPPILGNVTPNYIFSTGVSSTAFNYHGDSNNNFFGNNFPCSLRTLVGDTGAQPFTNCFAVQYDQDWLPGYCYGVSIGQGCAAHATLSLPDNTTYSSGVHTIFHNKASFYGPNDISVYDDLIDAKPNWRSAADENFHLHRADIREPGVLVAAITAPAGPGATSITYGCSSNCSTLENTVPFIDYTDSQVMNVTAISLSLPGDLSQLAVATLSVAQPVSVQGTTVGTTFIATTVANSFQITVPSTVGLVLHAPITGPGISHNYTYINSISGNTVTLSEPAIASGTNVTLNQGIAVPIIVGNTTGVLSSAITSITINIPSAITAGQLVGFIDGFAEVVKPTNLGVWNSTTHNQTITAKFYFPHADSVAVCVGGMVGSFINQDNNTSNLSPNYLETVYCSPTANTAWIGHLQQGSLATALSSTGQISVYKGAEVRGVINPNDGLPSDGYVTLADNNARWTPGDLAIQGNATAAIYLMDFENDYVNNLYAPHVGFTRTWYGAAGGKDGEGRSGMNHWINSVPNSFYTSGGITPYNTYLEGAWSTGLTMQYAPYTSPGQNVSGMACDNTMMCHGSPIPGSTTTWVDVYRNAPNNTTFDRLRFDYGSHVFQMWLTNNLRYQFTSSNLIAPSYTAVGTGTPFASLPLNGSIDSNTGTGTSGPFRIYIAPNDNMGIDVSNQDNPTGPTGCSTPLGFRFANGIGEFSFGVLGALDRNGNLCGFHAVRASSITTASYTVATLPAANSLATGTMLVITDSTSFTAGSCVGGGTDTMIAVTNGSIWTCH